MQHLMYHMHAFDTKDRFPVFGHCTWVDCLQGIHFDLVYVPFGVNGKLREKKISILIICTVFLLLLPQLTAALKVMCFSYRSIRSIFRALSIQKLNVA